MDDARVFAQATFVAKQNCESMLNLLPKQIYSVVSVTLTTTAVITTIIHP